MFIIFFHLNLCTFKIKKKRVFTSSAVYLYISSLADATFLHWQLGSHEKVLIFVTHTFLHWQGYFHEKNFHHTFSSVGILEKVHIFHHRHFFCHRPMRKWSFFVINTISVTDRGVPMRKCSFFIKDTFYTDRGVQMGKCSLFVTDTFSSVTGIFPWEKVPIFHHRHFCQWLWGSYAHFLSQILSVTDRGIPMKKCSFFILDTFSSLTGDSYVWLSAHFWSQTLFLHWRVGVGDKSNSR